MADIAILGANGQIGRGLALAFSRSPAHRLYLYARRPAAFADVAAPMNLPRRGRDEILPLDEFGARRHDVVINAVGDGERAKQIALGAEIFHVTETMDARVMAYLRGQPEALYFFMSTGAVYGFDAEWPVRRDALFAWPVNAPDPVNFYPLAKLVAEAKHRTEPRLRIYDIRIFGYFSRFIPLTGSFFLSEVAAAVLEGKEFRTSPADMVRDYIDHEELAHLIEAFVASRPANGAYDIYSRAPVGKIELLDRLTREFGLQVRYAPSPAAPPPRLAKPEAPTDCRAALRAGHAAQRPSIDIVAEELRALRASRGS